MEEAARTPAPAHDAFISYSRRDRDFAVLLERALEAYTPPKDLPVPQRHLDVFRDEDDFTGVDYQASIKRHLEDSARLIVLCSPHSRKSAYVDDEIRKFAERHPPEHVIPILVSGIPNNEAAPGQEEEMAFPDVLSSVMGMPLGADYREFDRKRHKINKGVFYGPWYTTLANLYSVRRSDIEERDKKREARRRRMRNGLIGGVVAVLSVALAVSVFYWRQAVIQRNAAIARRLATESQVVTERRLRALLATEAFQRLRTPESDDAIRGSIRALFYAKQQPDDDDDDAKTRTRVHFGRTFTEIGSDAKLSLDGRWVSTTSADRLALDALVYDVATGDELSRVTHESGVATVAVRRDGRRIATGAYDNVARVFENGEQLSQRPHRDFVVDVEFSPDGRYVATASFDRTARLFEADTGKEIWQLLHGGHVLSVAFSPDGRLVATGSEDKTARVVDAATGAEISRLVHDGSVDVVSFSADGRLVVAGSAARVSGVEGSEGRVFESATGREVVRLAHRGPINAAAFSPDGRWVATGGGTTDAFIFEVSSGAILSRIWMEREVHGVRFVDDGRYLLTVSPTAGRTTGGGVVIRHAVRPEDLVSEVCGLIGRNLTEPEWAQHVGSEVPYRHTCPER